MLTPNLFDKALFKALGILLTRLCVKWTVVLGGLSGFATARDAWDAQEAAIIGLVIIVAFCYLTYWEYKPLDEYTKAVKKARANRC